MDDEKIKLVRVIIKEDMLGSFVFEHKKKDAEERKWDTIHFLSDPKETKEIQAIYPLEMAEKAVSVIKRKYNKQYVWLHDRMIAHKRSPEFYEEVKDFRIRFFSGDASVLKEQIKLYKTKKEVCS